MSIVPFQQCKNQQVRFQQRELAGGRSGGCVGALVGVRDGEVCEGFSFIAISHCYGPSEDRDTIYKNKTVCNL